MPKAFEEKNSSTHPNSCASNRHDVNVYAERKASVSPDDQRREARQLPGVTISSPSGHNSPAPLGRKARVHGPKIVINEAVTASASPELGKQLPQVRREPTESDVGDDRSVSSVGSSADGSLLPTSFRYTLNVTCLRGPTVCKENQRLRWNDWDSYQKIQESARRFIEEAKGEPDEGNVITFRHGSCSVSRGREGSKQRLSLISQDDCRRFCKMLVTDYGFGSEEEYDIVIHQEFFELRIRPDELDTESFEEVKRYELDLLMKTNIDDKKFISEADLQKCTTEQMVRAIVTYHSCWGSSTDPDEKERLVQNILRERATKLLALCIYARVDMKCLRKLMDEERYYDGDLPSTLMKCCKKHQKRPSKLLDLHGIFQAAFFNTPGEYQQMSPWTVAPIIPVYAEGDKAVTGEKSDVSKANIESRSISVQGAKSSSMIGGGAHGSVYRVRIDPYHHKLSHDRDAEFALKEFRVFGSEEIFERESKIMEVLRDYPNPHLTTHVVMWTHAGRDYLLFPLAKCNLHEYMRKTAFEKTKDNQIWLLDQFCGLVKALRLIHNLSFHSPDANLSPHPSRQANDQLAGWHHDIKPENILYFENANPKHKTLQIADFGSSKIHIIRSRSHPTRTPRGTLTYEPPEMELEGKTSRPYDVWSLGCVFLEILVWAMLGFGALDIFKNERSSKRTLEGVTDDGFWEKHPSGGVTLRKSVQDCIVSLGQKIDDQPHQPFKELLELITLRMLEIDRTKRVLAGELFLAVDQIVESKKVILEQGIDANRHNDRDSEMSPVTLLPNSSVTNPHRRPSIAQSLSDTGPSPFQNPTIITDLEHSTASPIDGFSPLTSNAVLRRSSATSEMSSSPVIRSRALSNSSTSSHSPLNPNTSRNEGLSPTTLKPPSSPRPTTASHPPTKNLAPANADAETS